ncbi:hypothetical protein CPB86DRAFT_785645 [Serendipita vermifera]|nr:hypothetical protein CPB86DRAFT_785645 [Serendipita vermifera]
MRSSVNTNGKNYNNANGNNGKATPSASGSGPTPSLLTPRTSISSFASTSLSSPNSLSLRDPTGVPRPGSRGSGDRNSIRSSIYDSPRKLSVDAGSFAADATTAVSTQMSPSLAQFAPTPGAKSSLLQFGVERHERASTSRLSASTGNVVTRAQQQVDASTRRSRGTSQSHHASPSTGLLHERQDEEEDKPEPQFGLQFVTGWFGKQRDLPSISRGLEPDTTMDHSPFGGMEVTRRQHLRSATESMASSIERKNEKRPGPGSGQLLQAVGDDVDGGALASTPRPAFPIDSHVPQQIPSTSQPYLKDKEAQQTDAPRISALDKGKGRARPLSPTLTRHASSPPGDSRLRPNPSSLLSVPKPPTPPSKRSGGDLPTLAAIESGSRLMRQKIVCATCGGTGPDFPRCGRCGEAWCSRQCRTEANKATGGKHRCCASVA